MNQANQKVLRSILNQAKYEGSKMVTVFDLDSTLFCTDYRTTQIIQDSIEKKEFKQSFTQDLDKIKKFKIHSTDWSIDDIFRKQGFTKDHSAILFIHKEWKKHFFDNFYLRFDKPYTGSSQFLNELKKTKVHIRYLTARNEYKMREGTIKSLKKWNFPLEKEDHLILKKEHEMEDATYKYKQLEELYKNFEKIFFFENEPVILNLIQKELPEVQLFWINSTHSKKQTPPKKAQVITPDWRIAKLN